MFDRLLRGLNALGSGWVFVLMLMVCTDIASRFLFSAPIRGVAEIAGLSVVAITFLQLPISVRARRLARADILIDRIHASRPGLGRAMETLFALLGAAVFACITWAAVNGLSHAWRTGDQFGAQGVFTVAKWPLWLIVLVGSACVLLAFLLEAWGHASGKGKKAEAVHHGS